MLSLRIAAILAAFIGSVHSLRYDLYDGYLPTAKSEIIGVSAMQNCLYHFKEEEEITKCVDCFYPQTAETVKCFDPFFESSETLICGKDRYAEENLETEELLYRMSLCSDSNLNYLISVQCLDDLKAIPQDHSRAGDDSFNELVECMTKKKEELSKLTRKRLESNEKYPKFPKISEETSKKIHIEELNYHCKIVSLEKVEECVNCFDPIFKDDGNSLDVFATTKSCSETHFSTQFNKCFLQEPEEGTTVPALRKTTFNCFMKQLIQYFSSRCVVSNPRSFLARDGHNFQIFSYYFIQGCINHKLKEVQDTFPDELKALIRILTDYHFYIEGSSNFQLQSTVELS